MAATIVLTVKVFARPGTPSGRMWRIGVQAEKQPVDEIFLAYDHVPNLFAQRRDPATQFLDLLRDFLQLIS